MKNLRTLILYLCGVFCYIRSIYFFNIGLFQDSMLNKTIGTFVFFTIIITIMLDNKEKVNKCEFYKFN